MASHSPRYRARGDLLKFDGEDFSELDGIGAKTAESAK
jgi:hypothetical protein